MPAFELRGVRKAFGPKVVLPGLDLTVPEGKTTVLLGPSGCGKSTIIRLLVGLALPDAGEVRFEDRPLRRENLREARRRMGYVIQDGGLFPHLTARGNVTLLARHLRWSRERIDGRVAELIELARLDSDVLDRYPTELSGGQKQRVGLMRALMLDPRGPPARRAARGARPARPGRPPGRPPPRLPIARQDGRPRDPRPRRGRAILGDRLAPLPGRDGSSRMARSPTS